MPHVTDILASEDVLSGGDLQVLARNVVDGFVAGLHRSPHKGTSAQFKQHRPYVPGDDLRALDWKIYGKSDRFFIREFEDETNLRATLLLDGSRSMAYGSSDTNKHRYGIRLAACLAHLMLKQQDAVGLATFDARLRTYLPGRTVPRHLSLLTDTLAAESPSADAAATDFASVFRDLSPKLNCHAHHRMVLLITDAFGDIAAFDRGLSHLRHARHEVIVFQVLHRDEVDFPFRGTMQFDDLEVSDRRREIDASLLRQRYLDRMTKFRADVAAVCGRTGADLVPILTDEPLATGLRHYLLRRARGRRGDRRRASR